MLTDGIAYQADPARYDGSMIYRRCGPRDFCCQPSRWGSRRQRQLEQDWHGIDAAEAGIRLDLANNYGPPPGQAEINFGELLRLDLAPTATNW